MDDRDASALSVSGICTYPRTPCVEFMDRYRDVTVIIEKKTKEKKFTPKSFKNEKNGKIISL